MKEIKLGETGFVALVDDGDYEFLNQWKWAYTKSRKKYYASRNGYVSGKKKTIFMHRLILNTPDGMETDHIDGDSLNNQRSNLRIVTPQQNHFNKRPHDKPKRSKYTGVHIYSKKGHKYIKASISMNGHNVHLGNFPTERDAAIAYNEAALRMRGEFARLNVIDDDEWLRSRLVSQKTDNLKENNNNGSTN